MGQRLVVEIKRNDNVIASAYYHWSAYTVPALNVLSSMNKHVFSNAKNMTDEELQVSLIRFAERSTAVGYIDSDEAKQAVVQEFQEKFNDSPEYIQYMLEDLFIKSGGLSPSDIEYANQKFKEEVFKTDVNRNEGLISISEKEIQKDLDWAEGLITVNLDDGTILNGVIYEYDIQSYLEETEEDNDDYFYDPDDLPKSPINLSEFTLDEIEIVKDVIELSASSYIRYKDTIFQLIEG
jgi:hypothetical protein